MLKVYSAHLEQAQLAQQPGSHLEAASLPRMLTRIAGQKLLQADKQMTSDLGNSSMEMKSLVGHKASKDVGDFARIGMICSCRCMS